MLRRENAERHAENRVDACSEDVESQDFGLRDDLEVVGVGRFGVRCSVFGVRFGVGFGGIGVGCWVLGVGGVGVRCSAFGVRVGCRGISALSSLLSPLSYGGHPHREL